MLAQDEMLGYSLDTPIELAIDPDDTVAVRVSENDLFDNLISVKAKTVDGGEIHLVDYASAGKSWNNGKRIAVWFLIK